MNILLRITIILFVLHGLPCYVNAMELPQSIEIYLEGSSITEENLLPNIETDGKDFVEYVVENRVAILNNFVAIGDNPRKQKLLLAAMEFAVPTDYLATLDKVCDFKQSNVIGNDVFEFAIRATPMRRGFLSYNFQDQRVIDLVERVQGLVQNNEGFTVYLAAILDGSQKNIHARYFEVNELPEPEMLPPQ